MSPCRFLFRGVRCACWTQWSESNWNWSEDLTALHVASLRGSLEVGIVTLRNRLYRFSCLNHFHLIKNHVQNNRLFRYHSGWKPYCSYRSLKLPTAGRKRCPIFNLFYHHISSHICPNEFLFMRAGCQTDYWQESFKDSIHAPKALAHRIQQGTGQLELPVNRIIDLQHFAEMQWITGSKCQGSVIDLAATAEMKVPMGTLTRHWTQNQKHPTRCQVIDAFWVDRCELNVLYSWWSILLQLPTTNRWCGIPILLTSFDVLQGSP